MSTCMCMYTSDDALVLIPQKADAAATADADTNGFINRWGGWVNFI